MRLVAMSILALALSACSINAPMVSTFADPDSDETTPRVTRAQTETSEGSLSDRLSRLWDRVTTSESDATRADTKLAQGFKPEDALSLINAYRKQNGLKPLVLDDRLTKAAKAHASDLARNDRISHYGSDGSDPWDRVRRTGFKPILAAENVGTGQMSFREVFEDWKLSPEHKANLLLADASHVGLSMVHKPDTEFKTFWSLVIGKPAGK